MEFFFDCTLPYALRQLSTSDVSLWSEHVVPFKGQAVSIWLVVGKSVLQSVPFLVDWKIARVDSDSG